MKFYAPWCGHCLEMSPEWDQLGESIKAKALPGVDLTIGEVNCVEEPLLCLKQGVESYPTIKLYHSAGKVEDYFYARTFSRMKRYLAEKLIGLNNILFVSLFSSFSFLADANLPTNSIGTFTLDDFTFKKFIEKSKVVVVKYFVPGCQHCVDFKDVFDDLVMTFLMEESEDVQFAEVNCMDMDSLDTCIEESVNGFPAVYLYKV